MRVTLGGAEVDLVSRDEVRSLVLDGVQGRRDRPLFVASANLDHLYHFGLDSGREGSFDPGRSGADWLVLLDGRPLVKAARRLTGVSWEQLAGSDLLPELLWTASRARARVGFLGGSQAQHRALALLLPDHYPTLDVVGYWSPSRADVDNPVTAAGIAREIRAADVDLLVVGLGKPRQEEWLLRHGADSGARVAVAFGAAADFVAGTMERAPLRWRRLGAEWLYRLLKEPSRLARRYLVQGPSSMYRLLTQSRTPALAAAGAVAQPAVMSTPAAWRARVGKLLVIADTVIIGASSLLAYAARSALGHLGVMQGLENEVPTVIAVLPLWLTILASFGCYRPQYLSAGGEAFRRFASGTVAGTLALGFLSFALNLQLARGYVALLFLLVLTLGAGVRLIIREHLGRQRHRGRFLQNVLVVGADAEGVQVAKAMSEATASGYRIVGFIDDSLELGSPILGELRVVGRTAQVLDLSYDLRAGLVLVSPTGIRPGTLRELVVQLEGSPVDVAVAPSMYEMATRRVTFESVSNVPVLHIDQIRLERGKAVVKRAADIALALSLGILAVPLLALAAAAIVLDDGRPVLFRQTRSGRDGLPFTLYKLRTMVRDAEDRLSELEALNEAGHHFFKIRDDPRVTKVGRFLRKWSTDEVPQLWNVLRGDMSMIGPRPPLPSEVEKYEAWHRRRLRVRPGITGVWQVSGRANIPFDEAVRMDLFYIENWSLGYDLFLLGKTLMAVLGRRGAY